MTGKKIITTADLTDAISEERTEKFEKISEHETRIGCLEQDKVEIVDAKQEAGGEEKTLASDTDMNKL